MKIGIDIQALQTEGSKNRGIGRYSKNLFSKILELDKENDYTIFQNSYYNNSINLPKQNNLKFKKIVYANEKSLGFLNKGFNELMQFFQYYHSEQDILHVSSPFEGFPYKYPIISKHLPRLNCVLTTTLFDLIPLVFSNIYLNTNEIREYYFQRLDLLKKCDFIFSISEASKIDAINLLGIEPSKIINIGSAASANFYKTEIAEQNKQKILKKYSIPEHFILYTGGIDFRKNIERTIEAFSKLDTNLKKQFKFVIVCKVEPHERAKLQKLASTFDIQDNIILTGFVPDEELNILYNVCSLFLFPSLYEGAGLPILEAMRCGAPVISSNSSSLAELVKKEDFMFDPYDVDDMAALIEKALTDDAFRRQLQNHSYSNHSREFMLLTSDNITVTCGFVSVQDSPSIQPTRPRPINLWTIWSPTRTGAEQVAAAFGFFSLGFTYHTPFLVPCGLFRLIRKYR